MKEFAMSCRVAGKFVESALFASILEREGCNQGEMTVRKTKKNTLLRRTLQEIGFHIAAEDDLMIRYAFNSKLSNCDLVSARFRE